jgi:tetratricopeptide (TPR) repeat protein
MIVTALIALSHALIAQRKYPDAEACLQEALERIEKHPRPRYRWFKGEIQSRLGEAVAAQGKPQEAEKLLAAGYEGLRNTTSTPPPRLRAAMARLASFYAATGRPDAAASWRGRMRAIGAPRRPVGTS